MFTSDLIIIGSGPGGYRAADYAARNGLNVTIVENKQAGGTCLNTGCIPTKALVHDADLQKRSWAEAVSRKNKVVDQLAKGIESMLAQQGITMVHGLAEFQDAHTVMVDGALYSAHHIIIATGSEPAIPPIEGISNSCVITSNQLLSLKELPKSLCIIGAGVIGTEFASLLNSFGCKVTVIEYLKECLNSFDSDIAKRVRKQMERRGIDFHLSCKVTQITEGKVHFEDKKGDEHSLSAHLTLVATGRLPNLSGFGIEKSGVNFTSKGIAVNDNMQTNIPHIYAIGDCNGRQLLAHAATFQGFKAVNSILGKTDHINLNIIPAAVFANPETACAGLTLSAAQEQGVHAQERKGFYRANGRAVAIEADEGMVKLVTNENDTIIGCHAYGFHAADIVQEVASLMNLNVTRTQLADIVHIHPTVAEVLQDLAR